jgi:hypothetical protein
MCWLGRQGVFTAAFRNPNKDQRFQHNSRDVSELPFQVLSSAGVCLFLFSDCANAMTLEMSLAVNA